MTLRPACSGGRPLTIPTSVWVAKRRAPKGCSSRATSRLILQLPTDRLRETLLRTSPAFLLLLGCNGLVVEER